MGELWIQFSIKATDPISIFLMHDTQINISFAYFFLLIHTAKSTI